METSITTNAEFKHLEAEMLAYQDRMINLPDSSHIERQEIRCRLKKLQTQYDNYLNKENDEAINQSINKSTNKNDEQIKNS